MSDTLERLVPTSVRPGDATGEETFRLHVDRYRFAAKHLLAGCVIDIACGVGYGTRILVEERPDVTWALGVDVSQEAIAHANAQYALERSRYQVADAMSYRSDEPFDTAVSLETIEHLPDPAGFVANLLRSLRPAGRLIASVPTTPSVDANPHHKHDFTEQSFRSMFHRHGMREIASLRQVQPFNPVQILRRKEQRLADLRPRLVQYYLSHPHSAFRRALSTVKHGFRNHYLTIVWQKG